MVVTRAAGAKTAGHETRAGKSRWGTCSSRGWVLERSSEHGTNEELRTVSGRVAARRGSPQTTLRIVRAVMPFRRGHQSDLREPRWWAASRSAHVDRVFGGTGAQSCRPASEGAQEGTLQRGRSGEDAVREERGTSRDEGRGEETARTAVSRYRRCAITTSEKCDFAPFEAYRKRDVLPFGSGGAELEGTERVPDVTFEAGTPGDGSWIVPTEAEGLRQARYSKLHRDAKPKLKVLRLQHTFLEKAAAREDRSPEDSGAWGDREGLEKELLKDLFPDASAKGARWAGGPKIRVAIEKARVRKTGWVDPFKLRELLFELAWCPDVVSVQERYEFRCATADARITSCRKTAVSRMMQNDNVSPEAPSDVSGPIRGSIVYDEHAVRGDCLLQRGADRLGEPKLRVVSRNDNINFQCGLSWRRARSSGGGGL